MNLMCRRFLTVFDKWKRRKEAELEARYGNELDQIVSDLLAARLALEVFKDTVRQSTNEE